MPKTVYLNFHDISPNEKVIMGIVSLWVHAQKTPIPRKHIVEQMKIKGVNRGSIEFSLNALIMKGYIRRSYGSLGNKTFYVQLRSVL